MNKSYRGSAGESKRGRRDPGVRKPRRNRARSTAIAAEIARWGEVVKRTGMEAQ
jgi:hypothetical protein